MKLPRAAAACAAFLIATGTLAVPASAATGVPQSAVASASMAHARHPAAAGHCVKPTHLAHAESLDQWYEQTGIDPAIELMVVEQCDAYHHGWTPHIANLLNGVYGQNIFKAELGKGTLLWDQM